jgi:hypothetical protein
MTQPHLKNSQLSSLEEVAQQFEQWRATRIKRSRIPDELRKLIAPLMNQYGHNKIASSLRINHAQLKEYTLPFVTNSQKEQPHFIECPLPMMPVLPIENCTLEIVCKNGSTVKIKGLTCAQIQSLIPSWTGG